MRTRITASSKLYYVVPFPFEQTAELMTSLSESLYVNKRQKYEVKHKSPRRNSVYHLSTGTVQLAVANDETSNVLTGVTMQLAVANDETSNVLTGVTMQLAVANDETSNVLTGVTMQLAVANDETSNVLTGVTTVNCNCPKEQHKGRIISSLKKNMLIHVTSAY